MEYSISIRNIGVWVADQAFASGYSLPAEDVGRLDAICPKDYRDLVNSIDRTAAPVELPDESPVELIDEKIRI